MAIKISGLVIGLICLAQVVTLSASTRNRSERSFPDGFLWAVSSSAYQIEGAWNEDGKGESIWDKYTHRLGTTLDNSTGDIAADSYHQWKRDIEIVRELNVSMYRFSISWSRILPTGFPNKINEKGIRYYNNIIDELLRHNITPIVTLYHWDLPYRLQEMGGWTNEKIVGWFKDYAKTAFSHFGDRVQWWTTFNEPYHVCVEGYARHFMAPGYTYPGIPAYQCAHNLLLAHAVTVDSFRKDGYKGKIGIVMDSFWYEPKGEEDSEAVEQALQFYMGWFANPIFSAEGNYPAVMRRRIDKLSQQQGFTSSRLPRFTEDQVQLLKGSSDYFGFNTYTSMRVCRNDDYLNPANYPIPSEDHDTGLIFDYHPDWKIANSWWFAVRPTGTYHLLKWISSRYNNPEIIITENGLSDKPGLNDVERAEYHMDNLNSVLDALEEGVNVRGYTAWSLLDSFEWNSGYTANFGLYHVDFKSPNRTRTPKLSAKVYSRICKLNRINFDYSDLKKEFAHSSATSLNKGSTVTALFALVVGFLISVQCVNALSSPKVLDLAGWLY